MVDDIVHGGNQSYYLPRGLFPATVFGTLTAADFRHFSSMRRHLATFPCQLFMDDPGGWFCIASGIGDRSE